MTPKEQRTSAKPPPSVDPAQFVDLGKKQVNALVDMQRDLVDGIEEMSREWAERIKAETDLANEFAGKLSAAKSVPDTVAIYQEWLFAADSQKFLAKSTRLFSDGLKGPGT
jgi:phasin protein